MESARQTTYERLRDGLLAEIREFGHVRGELSSSALATAVATFALHLADAADHRERAPRAAAWLVANANPDGGWGDTVRSPSNLSTTLLVRCALAATGQAVPPTTLDGADAWIARTAGGMAPATIADAVLRHYGRDRTFSIPILTMCALGGLLGPPDEAWKRVPQLPFELAAFPHGLFRFLGLPVVSYALPALIAMGLVRHRLGGGGGPFRPLRSLLVSRILRKLAALQPANGGFLEAAPLTGFVTVSLSACGLREHPIAQRAVCFLRAGQRPDGSWPIDTNLATWLTTLAVKSLADDLPEDLRPRLRRWLLDQQFRERHPFTGAAPGGWGWTDLPGSVPDADDTAGALLALHRLGPLDPELQQAAEQGIDWLLDLANRDGGTPTFCRGWGRLPFDASTPDLTIHALQAFAAWRPHLAGTRRPRVDRAVERGLAYLRQAQRQDGSWCPLWFGNDATPDHANPVYGTARVVLGLRQLGEPPTSQSLAAGIAYLLAEQDADGGWGGSRGVAPSIEETSLAVTALDGLAEAEPALARGREWLVAVLARPVAPRPIGLYFASLWYFEARYPSIFAVAALRP